MKVIILNLIVLFVLNLSNAQDSFNGIDQMEDLGIAGLSKSNSDAINVYFKYGIGRDNVSNYIKELHKKVMSINIKDAKSFDGRKDLYKAIFKNSKGKIEAHYNSDGEIEKAYEEFKNVSLPLVIIKRIFSEYNGWSLHSNKLVIEYTNINGFIVNYTIKIKKGTQKKNIKIDAIGNLH